MPNARKVVVLLLTAKLEEETIPTGALGCVSTGAVTVVKNSFVPPNAGGADEYTTHAEFGQSANENTLSSVAAGSEILPTAFDVLMGAL